LILPLLIQIKLNLKIESRKPAAAVTLFSREFECAAWELLEGPS
jgi:hypothetical protein